jgi:hypothetical protein
MHWLCVALPVAALNVFAGQAVQTRSTLADGVFDTYVPIGQPVHGWQAVVALVIGWNVPVTQALHTRSEVAVPAAVTWPPTQFVYALQLAALFGPEVNVLVGQAEQVGGAVVVPSTEAYWPAVQLAWVQLVAFVVVL